MNIITNSTPRSLLALADIPLSVQADFDYIGEDSQFEYRMVNYKGAWYDVYDTQRISSSSSFEPSFGFSVTKSDPLARWDSILTESYFSGVVFRLTGDEQVICGRYCD